MGFYETIEKYYVDIFPLKPLQVTFIKQLAQTQGAKVLLDIGCATGAFAAAMAENLERVEAFDLDEHMVKRARATHKLSNLRYRVGNMLELDNLYKDQHFDIITCFGNTLVHLPQEDVELVLQLIKKQLSDQGVFVLQILNYDYVLRDGITELPLIDNEKIRFERYYDLSDPKAIGFKTRLHVKSSGQVLKNEITLYPIGKETLVDLLKRTGFKKITCYKNYRGDVCGGAHLPLILVAQ